ncbi:substrate-binding periplasmic protein [Iodobacter fluviatilis]|jgi:polar amino acid transport system substrate-binding protein|uniref:ABC transporter substrate-binding protein n=1 Tax=Iodobacter fluviatilis TaxID=537 RepID=A0A7G3GAF6_9NEIS|nr:ABC transporter substrate-binding protein [Iodobacter fluviatilis]QBC44510.1 ABC transporter substrate-binding protein [Iodobacter fluviatilis]
MKSTLLTLIILSSPAQALTLTTEDYPPFNIVDAKSQQVSGISTEKVIEVMARAKESYTITAYPWVRAYQLAQKERDTCVFSTTRTPERVALFQWVGPLVKNNWYIFAKQGDNRAPKNLDELKPYSIGAYHGDAIAEYLLKNGFKVDLAKADEDNPQKLLKNRFDFWATGELLGLAILKRKNLSDKISPILLFNQTELYLACNLNVDKKKIDIYNKILQSMDKDGSNLAIENKYRK